MGDNETGGGDFGDELFVNSSLQEQGENFEKKAFISMWRAVITQALMDAGSQSKKPENQRAKAEAKEWLLGDNEDFYIVCEMAEMNPDYVIKKARQAIERGCVWRRAPSSQVPKVQKSREPSPCIETKSSNFRLKNRGGHSDGLHDSFMREFEDKHLPFLTKSSEEENTYVS